jgi:carboxymethylenebutenolidase
MYARRTVLKSAAATAAGLPLATVLADPLIARAVAQTTDTVTLTLPSGREVSAALAMPETTPAPAILLIHEWWGLNDQIRSVAAEYAKEGYVALAVDLMGGEVATTPDEARALTGAVVAEEATETLVGWIDWLKSHEATTGAVGTVGWCFGGGWSLQASLATPVDATVVYYGRVPGDPAALASLESPVMGHFGTEDGFIDEEMVSTWTAAMNDAAKSYTVHWYEADHAFANPTGNAYDGEDAQLAWQRTLTFFDRYLRG